MNDYDVTIIVTASHNSREYVGLKIVKKDASYYTSSELRVMFESNQIIEHSAENAATIIQADLDTKLETLFSSLHSKFSSLQKKQKFVVDYGHGTGTHYEQQFISDYFGDLAIGLYTNPDGDFPAHETDTSRFANYQ
jgi:phosphomannomutase